MQDATGMADAVSYTIVRAHQYTIISLIFDLGILLAVLALAYYGVKRWKRIRYSQSVQSPYSHLR